MKAFFGTVFNALMWIIGIVLFFLILSGLYQRLFRQDAHTGFFGIGFAVVVSPSMSPNIETDDMIFYQKRDVGNYKKGDVIVYKKMENGEEILITHRILEIDDLDLVTKGDANNVTDEPITFSDVVGRVVWRIPYVGKAVAFVKKPVGLLCVGGGVLLIVLISFLLHRKKKTAVETVNGENYIRY